MNFAVFSNTQHYLNYNFLLKLPTFVIINVTATEYWFSEYRLRVLFVGKKIKKLCKLIINELDETKVFL